MNSTIPRYNACPCKFQRAMSRRVTGAILIWMYYHGPRHTDEHHHDDSLPHPQQATDDSSHESDSNSNEGRHHLLVSGAGDGPPLCSQNLGAPGGGPDNGPQDPDNTDDNGPQDPDNTWLFSLDRQCG